MLGGSTRKGYAISIRRQSRRQLCVPFVPETALHPQSDGLAPCPWAAGTEGNGTDRTKMPPSGLQNTARDQIFNAASSASPVARTALPGALAASPMTNTWGAIFSAASFRAALDREPMASTTLS